MYGVYLRNVKVPIRFGKMDRTESVESNHVQCPVSGILSFASELLLLISHGPARKENREENMKDYSKVISHLHT